jgi:hypothetical protein
MPTDLGWKAMPWFILPFRADHKPTDALRSSRKPLPANTIRIPGDASAVPAIPQPSQPSASSDPPATPRRRATKSPPPTTNTQP